MFKKYMLVFELQVIPGLLSKETNVCCEYLCLGILLG